MKKVLAQLATLLFPFVCIAQQDPFSDSLYFTLDGAEGKSLQITESKTEKFLRSHYPEKVENGKIVWADFSKTYHSVESFRTQSGGEVVAVRYGPGDGPAGQVIGFRDRPGTKEPIRLFYLRLMCSSRVSDESLKQPTFIASSNRVRLDQTIVHQRIADARVLIFEVKDSKVSLHLRQE